MYWRTCSVHVQLMNVDTVHVYHPVILFQGALATWGLALATLELAPANLVLGLLISRQGKSSPLPGNPSAVVSTVTAVSKSLLSKY